MHLYNDQHEKICTLSAFKERCVTSTLSTGDKELTFMFRRNYIYADHIKEEAYIRTKDDEFVVKQIEPSDTWYKCTAQLNVDELESKSFTTGFNTTEETASSCVNAAISGTGWKVVYCEVTKKRTINQESNCSAWDIIQSVITTYRCEIKFDSINKTISIYEKIGKDCGAYFIEKLNMKRLQVQSNSYDFATRLIPIGKDNLMLNINGKNYIENYQYSKKVKTVTWKDERYTVASSLQEDAEAKLDEISKPYRSYTAEIKDLAAANPDVYGEILSYSLGDVVMLVSKTNSIRESHRIVKTYEYPELPENNKVEIANTRLTFDEVQKQEQELATAEVVDAASSAAADAADSAISALTKEYIASITKTVEKNVSETLDELYSKKTDLTKEHETITKETKKAITDALESYSTTEQLKEIIEEAQTQNNLTIANTYATKKENEYAVTDYKKRILWVVNQLELHDAYIAEFGDETETVSETE